MTRILTLFSFFFFYTLGAGAQAMSPWSNTGPVQFPVNVSGQVNGMGRVCQIKFHPTNPAKMYAITSSGGLYISTDTGTTWHVTQGTDALPNTQTASVCIDYTNDNILYISTGDPNYYYDDYGIWKSTDGGITFNPANTGIGNRLAVEIVMDPLNHNNLIAATDDGIWKTTNAGASWIETQVGGQYKSMKIKPGSTTTVYATTDTMFFLSNDMGNSWTNISAGLSIPVGNGGLRVAVSAADTNVVYLATTDGYGEIFKSTNSGVNFNLVYTSASQCVVCYDSTVTSGSQGNYNFNITANPANANELLLVSHCVWRSTDGGATWSWRTQWYNQVHTDMHDIEFDPYDVTRRFNGNDGGVWMSRDTLATVWQPNNNGLAATEMYHAAQSPVARQLVDIGSQDNGEMYFDGIWKTNRGGDWGARCGIDYLGSGAIYYDNGNRRNLTPLGGDQSYNPPFTTAPSFCIEFTPKMTYAAFIGTDSLWRSSNINTTTPTWTFIRSTGNNILGIASCAADTSILYFVTDNNRLVRVNNVMGATPTFTYFTTPWHTNVSASIATDKYNANVVFLSCNDSVYRSVNQGATWTNITSNLPGLNILKLISDRYSPKQRIFVSEGNYVYYKDSTTTTWTATTGLPTIMQIDDFMIFNDSTSASLLRLSSYGRGVWESSINSNYPPSASYVANAHYICPNDTVKYSETIFGSYTSFAWSFPGGTPSTSTADSPMVVYPTTGSYNVTLIAYGPYGNDTVTNTNYVVVSNGTTSPILEGFEEATFPPSARWNLTSQSGVDWQHAGVGGYGTSAQSANFDNYDNSTNGAHDRLILPEVDFPSYTGVYLTFDVAYSWYGAGYNDTLQVEISTDCGKTFIPVYVKDSSVLATAPNIDSVAFVPDASNWRTDTVSLAGYSGGVTVAFDNIGHYGQEIYVDNINMYGPGLHISNVQQQAALQLYPNPTKDEITIKGEGFTSNNLSIAVYSMLGGQLVLKTIQMNNGVLNTTLDISTLSSGIYELIIQSSDGSKYVNKIEKL